MQMVGRFIRIICILVSTGLLNNCGRESCDAIKMDAIQSQPPPFYTSPDMFNDIVKVMTFNILYESGAEGAFNPFRTREIDEWSERKNLIAKIMMNYQPDIVALQETTPWQCSCLIRQYKDYAFVYDFGVTDSIVMYRRNRFKEIERGSIRLPVPKKNNLPNVSGFIPRTANWVVLKNRLLGKEIVVTGTHLDNRFSSSQLDFLGGFSKAIRPDIDERILLGDLNTKAESSAFKELLAKTTWRDARKESVKTYRGGNPTDSTFTLSDGRIDHVLVDGILLKSRAMDIIEFPGVDTLVSDHRPVLMYLEWSNN